MPFPQDLEGQYIEYKFEPGWADPSQVGKVKEDATSNARAAVYRSIGARSSTAAPRLTDQFENTNKPWNFTFLKYYVGAVTTAPLGTDLVTGPMTGCFLFTFTHGGQQKLAHVGTGGTRDCNESVEVKKAWVELLKSATGAVMGVSPFDDFDIAEFSAAKFSTSDAETPQLFAAFVGGPAYAMLLAPVPKSMGPQNFWKVAKVKQMKLQPWATIQKGPKFSHSRATLLTRLLARFR
jgi:hypothetical protein